VLVGESVRPAKTRFAGKHNGRLPTELIKHRFDRLNVRY
jgi:hypothetical protein